MTQNQAKKTSDIEELLGTLDRQLLLKLLDSLIEEQGQRESKDEA